MGLGAVASAVGIGSTLSGMATKKRQEASQQAQIMASQKAADASAALRKAEIDSSRDFAAYQGKLNALNRQQQDMQATLGSQASNILTDLQTSQSQFMNDQNLLQQQQGAEQQRGEASKQRVNTEQQASAANIAASGQSASNQGTIKGAAEAGTQALDEGSKRRAMMQAILAATSGGGGRTEDVLISKDLGADVSSALAQRLQLEGISEADLRQLTYSNDISEIAKQLGLGSADFMGANANRAEGYANTLAGGVRKDLNTSADLAKQNSATALEQMKGAMASEANSDKVSNILAEYGYSSQQNASNIQLSQQRSSLAAQSSSVNGGNNFFGILGAGLNAYNTLSSNGVIGNRQQQQQGGGQVTSKYGILKPYDYARDYGNTQPVTSGYTGNSVLLQGF